jgi:hypothetical protein
MFKSVAAALVSLVFVFSVPSSAQEKLTAGDVFSWFPEGSYRTLGYIDYTSLKKNQYYDLFKELFGDEGLMESKDSMPLPETAVGNIDHLIYGQLMKLKIRETVMEAGKQDKDKPHSADNMLSRESTNAAGRTVVSTTEDSGGKIWVFSFDDTAGLVKQGEKDGWLARAGVRINKQPVYKLVARGAEESQTDYFAYATPTNELLVAEEYAQLEMMVKAGLGVEVGMLDDADYMDLFPHIQDLGQSWRITPERVKMREQITLWSQQPDMDEKVRDLEEKLNNDVQYEITTFEVGDDVKAIQIKIFGDEELAKKEAARVSGEMENARHGLKEGMKQAKDAMQNIDESEEGQKMTDEQKELAGHLVNRAMGFANNLLENQETTVEGTVVKTIITFGERQLNNLRFILGAAKIFENMDKEKDEEK